MRRLSILLAAPVLALMLTAAEPPAAPDRPLNDLHARLTQCNRQNECTTLLVVLDGDAVHGRDRECQQRRGLDEEGGFCPDRGE